MRSLAVEAWIPTDLPLEFTQHDRQDVRYLVPGKNRRPAHDHRLPPLISPDTRPPLFASSSTAKRERTVITLTRLQQ